jgi:hypothetical protein
MKPLTAYIELWHWVNQHTAPNVLMVFERLDAIYYGVEDHPTGWTPLKRAIVEEYNCTARDHEVMANSLVSNLTNDRFKAAALSQLDKHIKLLITTEDNLNKDNPGIDIDL